MTRLFAPTVEASGGSIFAKMKLTEKGMTCA